MPKISVIVPVYKVEAYLPRCIDSILNQSFNDFELILVDDGSPDNCGFICDEYALKDSRIQVIHQKNAKLSAARNAGIDAAKGAWIALIDSDDWVHKDYLRVLLSGALTDTDIVICGCLITNKDNEDDLDYTGTVFRSIALSELYADHYAFSRAWGRIFRRITIGDLRYISGTEPAEDSCFNELLYRNDMKFRITDAKLYYYYMRPDSAIHTHMGRGTFNSIGPLLERLETIEDTNKRQRIISRCYKYVLSARYGEMYTDDYSVVKSRCNELFNQLSGYLSELDKKERVIMSILTKCPLLYRAWRICDDPTLLLFEKTQRKLRRERHRNINM